MSKSITFRNESHTVEGLFVKEFRPTELDSSVAPIVMVHGGSHGWWAFEDWLPLFAEMGRHCFSLSLRNHTDSYSIPEERFLSLSIRDYVDDVRVVLQWIGKRSILLGHSMGGIVVQKTPELYDPAALVLVASVGPGQLGPMRDPLPVDKPVLLDAQTVRQYWFHDIHDAKFRTIYERLVPESPSVMNEYGYEGVPIDRNSIQCPVLVIQGGEDRSSVHRAQDIADFYKVPFKIVPKSGHDLMLEPTLTLSAEYIHQWLEENV
jgi:pimeloyl-ACP methyl ester carboxylesterase